MDEITYMRQTDLADPLNLLMPINIIGAGSIGSWTALALTKLGCSDVTVWDADLVERHNAGSQIYTGYDDGKTKVDALKQKIDLISNERITVKNQMWDATNTFADNSIVISAVDTMAVRRELALALADKNVWFIDGRMAGNVINLYCTDMRDAQVFAEYVRTLFDDSEAEPVQCSARSVVYNTLVVGGLIGALVAQISNGITPKFETEVDLLNLKMY